jgi:quercetin dioxygenase-like cupin family protein
MTNKNPIQLIDIGIKAPGNPGKVASGALDPLRVDPKDYKLELENNQVRVVRVKIGPRQSVPMHEYTLNHVVVYFTDANVRETSPEGKAEVKQHKAGDFIWSGPSKHKIENLNDKALEAAVVEVKK